MNKLLIPILLLIGITTNLFAVEKSNKEKRGDKYYFVYSFDKAIDSYTQAKDLSVEGQRRLAESYHNLNLDIKAEESYSKLISSKEGILQDDYFNYAMVLKANGKYDQASFWMDKFREQYPEDLRAKDYAAHKGGLTKMSKDDGSYLIQHLNFNTDAEDFGPCYYQNKVVFASSRGMGKKFENKYNWDGKPFLDIYVSEIGENELKTPAVFDKTLDGKMHDGPASFSKDGTFMAFTRNNYDLKKKDRIVNVEICFSTYKDGKWSKPEPFILNNKEYSVGHPSLSADGNTMYFASDMPGGYGKADLYRITKDANGVWGKPENLGNKINTEGDELFPFYEENNGVLFFSSNGRFGLGGQDIFICAKNGSGFGPVVNAGAPLNTQSDDFGMIVDDKLNMGYFSSDRVGGSGGDDIYSVDLLKGIDIGRKIIGIAKDKDGNAIPKTFISLLDDKGNVIETTTTKDDGAYIFLVDRDKNFKLTGKKENYIDGENVTNTFGASYIVKVDVTLLKKENVVAETIEVGNDLGKVVAFNPIYFDYNKYNIRPDAEPELDKIVKAMNENPSLVIELHSYTDCRGTETYNQRLSDKRAAASVEYIKKRITKPERISGKGYGENNLLNDCDCEGAKVTSCSEPQHQKNRRSEFIIKKK